MNFVKYLFRLHNHVTSLGSPDEYFSLLLSMIQAVNPFFSSVGNWVGKMHNVDLVEVVTVSWMSISKHLNAFFILLLLSSDNVILSES